MKIMEESAKNEKIQDESKETRWERISKKHLSSVQVTTEKVKKFFEMEYINEHQLRTLNGEPLRQYAMNPLLVMDLRHEVIRKSSKTNSTASQQDAMQAIRMEKVNAHKNNIEEHYLANEIKKFQSEMDAKRKRNAINPKLVVMMHQPQRVELVEWDNSPVLQALAHGHKAVQHFYRNSYNGESCITEIDPDIVELPNEEITPIERTSVDILNDVNEIAVADDLLTEGTALEPDDRCVRFGDTVEIINYNGESSSAVSTASQELSFAEESSKNVIGSCETLSVELTPKARNEPLELVGRQMQKDIQLELIPKVLKSHTEPNVGVVKELSLTTTGNLDAEVSGMRFPLTITKYNTSQRNTKHNIGDIPAEQPPEQNNIIAELFKKNVLSQRMQHSILQKYFQRWIHFTTIEKMNSQNMLTNKSRARTIETFLSHIRLEKKKLTAVKPARNDMAKPAVKEDPTLMAKKYNNKLKIQQDIIDLQKLKLERQERMITELKLTKIEEETRDSQAIAKQELRNVIKTGCAKSKTTARCLQVVGNLKDEDEPDEYAKLQARGVPKFLIEMQARAWERNQRHQEARDRRDHLERVKEEQRLAAEQAKHQQDEEAKRQRIAELHEKRRQERLLKQQREQDRLRFIANQQKAIAFHRHLLLTRCGMDRFRRLIQLKRRNLKKAIAFHRLMLTRITFKVWLGRVHQIWDYRKRLADAFYDKCLLRMAMGLWIKHQQVQHSKMLVAIDWHEMKLTDHFMGAWKGYTRQQKLLLEVKMHKAQTHYNWHLKWRVIEHWQRLHTILRLEKETDERRMRWRMKIWELQPDYSPNPDDSNL